MRSGTTQFYAMKRRSFFRKIVAIATLGMAGKLTQKSHPTMEVCETFRLDDIAKRFDPRSYHYLVPSADDEFRAMKVTYNQIWDDEIKFLKRPIPGSKT